MGKPGGGKVLVQLALPFLLLGVGGVAGFLAGAWVGAAIGAGAGLILVVLLFVLISRAGRDLPGCRCGESKHDELESKRHKKWGYVFRCSKCMRSYMMINEAEWDEIMEDGSRVPYKTKGALGGWKEAVPSAS